MSMRVVQAASFLGPGDGVGSIIFGLHEAAQRMGLDSRISVIRTADMPTDEHLDPNLEKLAQYAREARSVPTTFVYHFGILNKKLDPFFCSTPIERKVFYFHNVTPPEFFRGWNNDIARELRATPAALSKLMAGKWVVTGDSQFNIDELGIQGRQTLLPPVLPTPTVLDQPLPPSEVRKKACTDMPTLLFVGRYAPNKRQDLILFALRDLLDSGVPARLILAGKGEGLYVRYINFLIRRLGLTDHVKMILNADTYSVHAFYRFANYFVAPTEHEGFCLPVVEALQNGCLPIVRPFGVFKETLAASPTMASDGRRSTFTRLLQQTVRETFGNPDAFLQRHQQVDGVLRASLKEYWSREQFLTRVQSADWGTA